MGESFMPAKSGFLVIWSGAGGNSTSAFSPGGAPPSRESALVPLPGPAGDGDHGALGSECAAWPSLSPLPSHSLPFAVPSPRSALPVKGKQPRLPPSLPPWLSSSAWDRVCEQPLAQPSEAGFALRCALSAPSGAPGAPRWRRGRRPNGRDHPGASRGFFTARMLSQLGLFFILLCPANIIGLWW